MADGLVLECWCWCCLVLLLVRRGPRGAGEARVELCARQHCCCVMTVSPSTLRVCAREQVRGCFGCVRGWACRRRCDGGDFVVVNCTKKNTKNRDKCRSILASDTSAARDLRPRKGDSNPIELPRRASLYGVVRVRPPVARPQEGEFCYFHGLWRHKN